MARPSTHRAAALRRRDALLSAAQELAGEEGLAAVTHRALAQRAGVALSNTTYFFSSLDELLDEALQRFVETTVAEIDAIAASVPENVTAAQLSAWLARRALREWGRDALLHVETYLYAARNAAGRAAVAEIFDAHRRLAVACLRAVGVYADELIAWQLVAVVNGFVLRHVANPQPDDEHQLCDAVLALLIAARSVPCG